MLEERKSKVMPLEELNHLRLTNRTALQALVAAGERVLRVGSVLLKSPPEKVRVCVALAANAAGVTSNARSMLKAAYLTPLEDRIGATPLEAARPRTP